MKQHQSWTLPTFNQWFSLMTEPRNSTVFLASRSTVEPQNQKNGLLEEDDPVRLIKHAIQTHANAGVNYAFIHLDSGHVGRAHHTCREGDKVYLLAGADMPVVLRRGGKEGTFRVVAPAFIVGAMDGELWPDKLDAALEPITLV
ncbi:heterokaryon incompatibility protein-domain-containing protein [Apiospora phragmitis]|uniref:Heterokaryon incompatibility protein-domain-containing protein n=1 Tax=Apiospora phragmitis TaxID=2905665 RepID=A0ABR1U922_9PEZI